MSVDVGSAKGYLDLDISGFLSGLKTAQSEANAASNNIATKVGNNISKAGKSLTSAGTTLTKTVTVPLLGIGAVGLKVATDFEKGMSEVRAISGATGKDFDALKDKAIELGASTAFSAGEVSEAMTEMAKAGWSSQQIIDGMSGVLDAAAASGEGLATVSTIVADTITGFGMAAADSSKVADLLTQAANSGTIGITDLGESFKYIAPVASSMGLSVEDVTTAISAMSMAGIKGSQAGTSLRTMLTRMVKPTDQVAVAMDELGLELTNTDGTFKSLDDIIAMMRNSFGGLTDEQKTYYATVLAGQEGMSGMLSLLNLTEEEYNKIAVSMEKSGGVAKETAAVMQDNLQSKVEQLLGSLESLAIKLADHLIPFLQKFIEWLTQLVEKFVELDPEGQKTILMISGIVAAIGPALVVIGKLVTAVGSIVTACGSMSSIAPILAKLGISFGATATAATGAAAATTAVGSAAASTGTAVTGAGAAAAGASNPIGWIILAITALIGIIVTLWTTNDKFKDKIIETWNKVKEMFSTVADTIVRVVNRFGFEFENVGEIFKALGKVIFAVWKGFCDLLGPPIAAVFQYIVDSIKWYVDSILFVIDLFSALLTGDWEGAWNAIKTFLIETWEYIVGWLEMIFVDVLLGTFDVVLGWFGTSWSECWEGIKTFIVNIWNVIVPWFKGVLTEVGEFFTNIWNGLVSFFTSAWDTIKSIVQVGIMFVVELIKAWFNLVTLPFRFIWENCKEYIIAAWETIKTAVSTALNAISTFISNVWNGIKAFLQPILTAIANIVSTVWNNIKTAISNVVNAISTTVSNIFNSIKTTVTNIFNSIKSTATNIWNGIKQAISGPINTAKTTISNVINSIKSIFTSGFNAAKTTVTSVFNSIKTTISNVLNTAKTTVQNAINKIKGMFNFSWSFPKLKMPHFSITGKFSLNPPSVPKLSISWYKKAMSGGMILNSPTIFGYDSSSGQFLGGGEAGSETVVGTASLMSMIRQAVKDVIGPIIDVTYQLARTSTELGYVTYNGFVKQAQVFEKVATSGVLGGGDTFNFYSPKALDEIEAAKQMKKAKRDLAEGF